MSRHVTDDDRTIYSVIANNMGQYSMRPLHTRLPFGWTDVGKSGTRQECLDYIGTLMPTGQSLPDGRSAAAEESE